MSVVLIYIALALAAVIYYFIHNLNTAYSYFKDRGIPQLETQYFYGNGKAMIVGKMFQSDFYANIYNKFKSMGVKHGGVYLGKRRIWVPVNPEVIKAITTKDFSHFSAHFPKFGTSIMLHNLFMMNGEEWKDMRKKLTPTFTSGKIKMMYSIVLDKSNGLVDLVGRSSKSGQPIEMKQALARYTTDIIGSCGFGIECNSLEDVNSEFFQQGQNMFKDEKRKQNFAFIKTVLEYFGLGRIQPHIDFSEIENFFKNVVTETIEYREKNKVMRKDFLHLMIQLKNKGVITELTNENEDVYQKTVDKEVISMDALTGQCLLFFNAGFETSSTTMSFALLELTQNQDVQKKLREEVREVLKRHNGILSYEALQEMKYCESVVDETLRKYPAVGVLPRMCTQTYKIPGTDSVIDKWTTVMIPILGLQMDPEYFPNPEKFDPDRFSTQNKSKIKDFTYIPFGEGPRMCLGMRFAIIQSKLGLATLVNKYNFTLNKQTPFPPKYLKTVRLIGQVDGGVWLNATEVD